MTPPSRRAAKHLWDARHAAGLAAAIPGLPRVVAFRNILVHGYADVDDRLVWGVVERDLPGLREILGRLLGEAGERP